MASHITSAGEPLIRLEPSGSGFFTHKSKLTLVVSLLLFLSTLLTYNPVTQNSFVEFDDPTYIAANKHVTAGLTWETARWAFTSTELANWHPLTWLSHALDYQLFQLRPAGPHYVNVLLHASAAVLLFLFFEIATGFVWRSAFIAALFALHPLNVESVAWAAERKSVLAMFFFALVLLAYRRYSQRPGWQRFLAVALLFAMGLMAKPILVVAPFLLLLFDYWPLQRTQRVSPAHLVLEKLPLLAMSAADSFITMISQKSGGAIHSADYSLTDRILNGLVSYARYMGKLVWPWHLAAFYPHPASLPAWKWISALALLAGITALVAFRHRDRYLTVGWLWFLGAMVPVIGIIQVGEQAMADRYAYLPFIGLFVAVVWAIADWAQAKHFPAKYLMAGTCAVLIAFALRTYTQIGYWHDTKTLWTHTLAVTGPNYVAEDSLGAALMDEGKLEEAKQRFERAVAINPRDAFGLLDLGVCEKKSGHLAEAIRDYQTALHISSDRNLQATAMGNLGSLYRSAGDYTRARAYYESALQLVPDYNLALTSLGLLSQKAGDVNAAVAYFSHAATLWPSDTQYLLLAQALAKAGRQEEAQQAQERAKAMSRNWEGALANVNYMLAQTR